MDDLSAFLNNFGVRPGLILDRLAFILGWTRHLRVVLGDSWGTFADLGDLELLRGCLDLVRAGLSWETVGLEAVLEARK